MSTLSLWTLLLASSSIFHNTQAAECISRIKDIYTAEKAVTNINIQRTYIICPNRRYKVGTYDYYGQSLRRGDNGEPPLPLLPNIKLQCGEDAHPSSSRSCFITSGDLQVDGTTTRGLGGENIGNVEIVGFVFEAALKHSFWATKSGSVTFQNCEWTNIDRSSGPIMLDYFDNFGREEMLTVSFEDCKFHNNQYFGYGAQTALVTGNSKQNKMTFARTVFLNNDMENNISSAGTRTHLIESLGEVSIQNSCFVNNKVAAANIAVYDSMFTSSEVVHANDKGGSLCQYASVFENYKQYQSLKPSCIPIDSSKTVCDLDIDLPTDRIEPVNHYVPFTINALEYDSSFEKDHSRLEGGCNRLGFLPTDGPDAQNTNDPICLDFGGCHVSHSVAGEYLVYRFAHSKGADVNGQVFVDISVRVASYSEKKILLELMYDKRVETKKILSSEGLGYQKFSTITWRNVPLKAEEPVHSIRFWFVDGNINFCAIGVEFSGQTLPPPTPVPTSKPDVLPGPIPKIPPIIWQALDYDTAYERSPNKSEGGCNNRGDGVDAQTTTDNTCINRDHSKCNIGWWAPDEYLIYQFTIPQGGSGMYNIRARAATRRSNRYIKMDLTTKNRETLWNSTSLSVPKHGKQNFNDIFWNSVFLEPNQYSLKLKSSGNTNLCSVAVLLSDTSSGPDPDDDNSKVVVPGIYSAMYYSDADFFDTTTANRGNCPFRKDTPIDAKINNDSTCKQSKTNFNGHCNIAFTAPNEYLVYDFKAKQDSIKVSLRVASKRKKKIHVELYSSNMVLLEEKVVSTLASNSWNGYHTLVVWDQIGIGNEETFKMKITFLQGQVNLCSFEIK
uniref:Right handed beta helix domain-containing protein n=1 Tax=Pseudo-nitzschia australis TaxID=44445 RepID=A0A7S4AXB1_9STRA|mmetsp:Transcript_17562/g.38376  ORF Transcript_17562/g.38376 Transcript_17562/m.38376 type:complete len:839 (-) Transcript_17562:49-2565(-)